MNTQPSILYRHYTLFVLFWFDIHIAAFVVVAVIVVTGKSVAHATQQNNDHSHIWWWEMVYYIESHASAKVNTFEMCKLHMVNVIEFMLF